jgi:hypothetical protein
VVERPAARGVVDRGDTGEEDARAAPVVVEAPTRTELVPVLIDA